MTDKVVERMRDALMRADDCPQWSVNLKPCSEVSGDHCKCHWLAQAAYDASGAKELLEALVGLVAAEDAFVADTDNELDDPVSDAVTIARTAIAMAQA